jgi:hypothetical protein
MHLGRNQTDTDTMKNLIILTIVLAILATCPVRAGDFKSSSPECQKAATKAASGAVAAGTTGAACRAAVASPSAGVSFIYNYQQMQNVRPAYGYAR